MALVGDRKLVKPVPAGFDDWSHPYHGPDNNPNSTDRYVKGEFRTQFIGMPQFSPMPEQSVIAGGRIFKAMGHIAHKSNQNEMLNTLLCINAYNGTILWRRKLSEGFMIHRNTMIATDDALYMGDHESCKVIDARTGEIRREITIDAGLTDGPVWKWMALKGNVLYALVGNPEVTVDTLPSVNRGLGHWPWGMWKGHDYADPRTAFGFGRTLVAVDRNTGKLLWHYRDDEFLDARAVCMSNDRLYCMSPGKFLLCVGATDGRLQWRNNSDDLLQAIGPNERAQHFLTGYATTCYMKCNDDYLFFAGPQRKRMVVASTKDGRLLWTHDIGNLQLVLRDDAIYAAGPQQASGVRLDYASGRVLSSLARPSGMHSGNRLHRQRLLPRGGRHHARHDRDQPDGTHRPDAAAVPGRRAGFQRPLVLGAVDVRLRALVVREHRLEPRGGSRRASFAPVAADRWRDLRERFDDDFQTPIVRRPWAPTSPPGPPFAATPHSPTRRHCPCRKS